MRLSLISGMIILAQIASAHGQEESYIPTTDASFATDNPGLESAFSDVIQKTSSTGCAKSCKCNNCCYSWGKDTSLSVGAGIRASYRANENGNPNGGTSQDFNLDNTRLYFNGKGHKRIGFEFNTDITNAQGYRNVPNDATRDDSQLMVLDAILKFQLTDNVNLWVGRMLPPSDRSNLDGPFYLNAWDFPFSQFGYSNIFQGRDDGATLWGERCGGKFKWQIGVFDGESSGGVAYEGHPATDNLMMNGRVVVNLLDPEPGYYNASTYYGEKNILAIGLAAMHRHDALSDGAGGEVDYTSWNLDVLFEKPLANCGVATIEAAYYDFDDNGGLSDATGAAITLPPHNAARQGESYFILGSYLFPNQCCILGLPGRFQALTRYQEYDHDAVGAVAAGTTDALDLQLNYIMFGHKARISAVWTQLDTAGAGGEDDLFTIGTQLQF